MELTDEQRAILVEVAGRWYRSEGAREQAVRDELAIGLTRFWQIANELCDDPAAALAFPSTVGRLRRLRDQRRQVRTAHRASYS